MGWEAFLAAAVVSAVGCAHARTDPARPLELIVANDPETLDPRYATDAVGVRVSRLLHAGLVRLDPDTLAPLPYLARSWRWQDARTLEVELRDDVRFHSGTPLGARDVVETLRALSSASVGSRQAGLLDAVADAREEGPHTVTIRLARPHATLLTDLELPILRASQAWSPPAPDGSLDGLGPFAVARVEHGAVVLVPADGGPLPRPAHAVAIRTVHDENARALRLAGGHADVAVNVVSPMLLPTLAREPGLFVTSREGANLTYVVVQHERPLLDDPRVRRAISLGIDRETIARTLFDGHAHPAGGLIGPANWAHANTPPLAYDPGAARALLAQAAANGSRFGLLTSTDRLRGDVARYIAQELADVGICVDVMPLELGTMIARLNAGEFDLAILAMPEMTEPNVLRNFLHGSFAPPFGANRGRVRDPVLDGIFDRGDAATEPDARRAIYAELEAREREQMHLVPLWYEDQVAVTSVRAQRFVPSAEGRWLSLAALP